MSQELIIVIALALSLGFLTGMRNVSNIVATMISSRAFEPQVALGIASVAQFIGPFIFGVMVATTIGDEVVQSKVLTLTIIAASLLGAIAWSLITWYLGLPGSSSHTLIGGLIGAVWVGAGSSAIRWHELTLVLTALLAYPLLGFLFGFIMTRLIYFLIQNASLRINDFFKHSQLLTATTLALGHGTNDAQKTVGMIALSLVVGGFLPNFQIPLWVIVVSAGSIALGASFGGWRVIRTLGGKLYKIRPLHSFATQLTAALLIVGASLFGAPISTSQVVSSAIIGVGASERISKVRWGVAGDIVTSWIITIPASALLSAGFYWVLISI
ncbi:MAG: inorganic phosphate transporter [Anaerolineales bacterium]|nr:inorganic phosphate transporter [Anaerolineales bacterium]